MWSYHHLDHGRNSVAQPNDSEASAVQYLHMGVEFHGWNAMLTDLLELSPIDILERLDKIHISSREEAERGNLLGLAFVAAARAREGMDLEWALVALRAYQILANVDQAYSVRDYTVSSMVLRAYLIRHLGHVAGDEILDSATILQWFYHTVDVELDEAKALIQEAKELMREVRPASDRGEIVRVRDALLRLRRLKSKIYVLQQLYLSGTIQPPEEIQPWLDLERVQECCKHVKQG